jgi:hypothetical protein
LLQGEQRERCDEPHQGAKLIARRTTKSSEDSLDEDAHRFRFVADRERAARE